MEPSQPVRGSARTRRLIALVVGGLLGALLLSVAVLFSNAAGTAQVANSARQLHWANSTAAAAASVRAATAQALVFAVDVRFGVALAESAELALTEARRTVEALNGWIAAGEGITDAAADPKLATFSAGADAVLDLIEQGAIGRAETLRSDELETVYQSLTDELESFQAALADDIGGAEAAAGRVERITRTLVTLLIPLGAILMYHMLVRGQLRRRRTVLEAKLEAERELSRAKDDFIAGISHELRTPLTSIYGFSEYLLDQGLIDPDEARELIGLINYDSAELSRMVEDLLTAARLDAENLAFDEEAVDLLAEVQSVVAPFQRAGTRIKVSGDRQVVLGDGVRVRQVMRNLLSNAAKHGGPDLQVHLEADGEVAMCTVSDNGRRIDTEIESRMFDRFVHDGKETLLTGSVGLGLAIAKSVASRMSGDITYRRTVLDRTEFTLTLPLAPAEVVEAMGQPPQPEHEDVDTLPSHLGDFMDSDHDPELDIDLALSGLPTRRNQIRIAFGDDD